MTQSELNQCMNLYITLWKSTVVSSEHRDSLMETWVERGLLKLDCDLFRKALYEYEDTAEKAYIAPRHRQIMDAYRTVEARAGYGKRKRRIVTEDETMYGYYQEEMAKPPEKRNEWLIRQCLPSCKIMTDPEAYKAKYGKYREEYEPY